MKVAITGVRNPADFEVAQHAVTDTFAGLQFTPTEITTGAQWGMDTEAALQAMMKWPTILHRVVIPGHTHNTAVADMFEFAGKRGVRTEIVRMPLGTTYLERNDRMLDFADILIAFPRTKRPEQRSGTWHTIRQARKRGIPIMGVPLNGAEGWVE